MNESVCSCVPQALEEALNLHSPTSQAGMNLGEGVLNLRQQELHTQIAVLKEQVRPPSVGASANLMEPVDPRCLFQSSGSSGSAVFFFLFSPRTCLLGNPTEKDNIMEC